MSQSRFMPHSFNLLDAGGCAVLLESEKLVTRDSSNYVSLWGDQSGHDRSVSQASPKRPLYTPNQWNGYPIISGDLSDDYLLDASVEGLNGLTAVTLFFVLQAPAVQTNIIAVNTSNTAMQLQAYGGNVFYRFYGATGVGRYYHAGLLPLIPTIISIVFNGAIPVKVYWNGVEKALLAYGTYPSSIYDITWLTLFGSYGGQMFGGSIAAFAMFTRPLAEQQRKQIERLYGWKYGISVV
jgi:hypothetical protein